MSEDYGAGPIEVMIMNPEARRWTTIPNQLVENEKLSYGARLLAVLYFLHMPDGLDRVCELMGVTRRGLERFDKELESAGLLRFEFDGVSTTVVLMVDA